ncbi:MAG: aldehyde ferredoxin oxidoreductase family protein [Chloroflexota bacterium]
MHGFTGKILHVDLTNHELEIEQPSQEFYRTYMGGSLLGLYYLWKNTPAGADPLGPNNTLTLAVGPATGMPVSGQSRCTATCKSPSSGGAADSQAGGFWPAELKFAGFDAVVVKGASDTPVYLWIHDGEAELRDASHLWGKTTLEVDNILKDELDDKKIEIAQIGPAGEKMANFAAIINMSNRAWGRTGTGAVMGSKKLKAIVVRGSGKIEPADKKGITKLSKWGAKAYPGGDMEEFGRYGTPGVVMPQNGSGGLPTRNWSAGYMAEAEAISGERLYDEILRGAADGKQDRQGRDTCYACIIRCKRVVASEWKSEAHGNPELIHEYGGPEYETIATFGSYCGIDDLHAVVYANQLCNEYGVDTISCGATLSWAMECYENGVLTAEEMDGIPLGYGNAEAMITMLKKTLNREGFGDILAEGSAKAADRLGKGHEYLLTIKGQELPAHMPQVKRSLALIYAVNPFGADHQSSEHDPSYSPNAYEGGTSRYLAPIGLDKPQPTKVLNAEKVEFTLKTQYNYSAMDTISICQFVYGPGWQLYDPTHMADLMTAATGWDVSVDEIQEVGRRRLNLMRAYNAREGLQRDKDTLPKKLFNVALEGGRSDGIKLEDAELQAGMDMYFEQAGWDVTTGVPTRQALVDAGLAWVADDMALAS